MTGTAPRETITVEITAGRETRTITTEAHGLGSEFATVTGLVGVIGAGLARYPARIYLDLVTAEHPAARGNTVTTDQHGRQWQYNLRCHIRNRQARVTGWEATLGRTNDRDQTRR